MESESNNEIALALIEHTSMPLSWLLITLFVGLVVLLLRNKLNVREIGLGSFHLRLENASDKRGLKKEFLGLQSLSQEQLHLFLVIGGETGDQSIYQSPIPEERAKRNWKRLSELGLLEVVDLGDNKQQFKTTVKGREIHKTIMDEIYAGIVLLPEKRA